MSKLQRLFTRTIGAIATVALTFITTSALAVQPDVKTVPWVASNPLIPHDAFSGVPHTLKGTADVQGANFEYTWDFGDASPVMTGTVTDQYAIEASHAYTGTPGTIFAAQLTVRDTTTGDSDTETYFVAIRDMTLETEVNAAIDEGLWYLHKTMNRTTVGGIDKGDWLQSASCSASRLRCASTTYYAIVPTNVNAFFVNGHVETGDASNPYTETVQRAMKRVFELLGTRAIANQTYPAPIGLVDPDVNGNGVGIEVTNIDPPYQGGQFMDAIVASGTPLAVTTTGAVGIINKTYAQIVQDMADMYAFGQSTTGAFHGGWRYSWNYASSTQSDNSTNQWAAIGMIAAERAFGSTVPVFVKQSNENSVNLTQITTGANAGQFGYTNSTNPVWGPYATTPSGMVQMAMDGIGRGDARWDRSENYMRDRFCNSGSAGSAVRSYLYGLFSFTKSMLLHDANGDGVSEPITNLSNQPGNTNGLDWYAAESASGAPCDGVARTLVGNQFAVGAWYGPSFTGTQSPFTTAWSIIMLNRTVFDTGQPVAVAEAVPNPAVVGQTINLSGANSFHQDAALNIVAWEWDLDNDGLYDDATGVNASTSFGALGNFVVGLRVTDDDATPKTDTTTVTVIVDTPPIAPTADANGPYAFCPQNQPWRLDGTGSVNPDEGGSELGQPGDTIQSYEWELDNDGQFDDASGAQPDVTAFFAGLGIGDYLVQLRVTDTTGTSYPSSNLGDLSDTDSAQVSVKNAGDVACACIDDLTSRPKSGKIQLVWSDSGPAGGYNVYRSTTAGGPYTLLANTTSSYSTYLDSGLVNGTTYYYVVRVVGATGDELCQSNETSATPMARRRR